MHFDERMEIHCPAWIRAEVVRQAQERGLPLGEMASRLLATALGKTEADGIPPRKPPGRKIGSQKKSRRQLRRVDGHGSGASD